MLMKYLILFLPLLLLLAACQPPEYIREIPAEDLTEDMILEGTFIQFCLNDLKKSSVDCKTIMSALRDEGFFKLCKDEGLEVGKCFNRYTGIELPPGSEPQDKVD